MEAYFYEHRMNIEFIGKRERKNKMKKIRIIITSVLMVMALMVAPFGASASAADLEFGMPYFLSFNGVITGVSQRTDGSIFVSLENEETGMLMNFVVNEKTYMVSTAPVEGAKATGYFYANRPAIMIYPPQQTAIVMEVNPATDRVTHVNRFDENLISYDNSLRIISTSTTQVINQRNETFVGDLRNRDLVVIYNVATFSIPAQTTPIKVIVLDREVSLEVRDASELDMVVNNKIISAPDAYYNQSGVLMVPLRAVAQELGYSVMWEHSAKIVFLDNTIAVYVDRDYYTYARMAPIQLGTAAENHKGIVYVPLSFFTEVMRLNNAYVFEGQIVIDNLEKMN